MNAESGSVNERLFFVHIMKTAGTSLRFRMMSRFAPAEVYPDPSADPDQFVAYSDTSYLLGLPADRQRVIRAYSGHFPFAVVEAMPGPFVTMTVLRDPVERTLSFLKQVGDIEDDFRGRSLEEIYEDPWKFGLGIHNYQVRVFALTEADVPFSVMNGIDIDDRRYARAEERLRHVDILGVQERYEEFAARVDERFGWPRMDWPRHRSGAHLDAPASLRRRIALDNAADVEFYARACDLSMRARKQ